MNGGVPIVPTVQIVQAVFGGCVIAIMPVNLIRSDFLNGLNGWNVLSSWNGPNEVRTLDA
jgi:hypothetical protein